MPKVSATDRAAILADWDLATIGGNGVQGIFENLFVEVKGIESRKPTFLCDEDNADALSLSHGSTIVINAVSYRVINKEPDGTGFLLLILEKS